MIPKGRMSSKKEKQITHILQKTRQTAQNSRTIMDFSTPIITHHKLMFLKSNKEE